jgi:hypothetical protein
VARAKLGQSFVLTQSRESMPVVRIMATLRNAKGESEGLGSGRVPFAALRS